jgi:hypothetical protein
MCNSVSVKKAVQKRQWVVQKMAVEGWKKSLTVSKEQIRPETFEKMSAFIKETKRNF